MTTLKVLFLLIGCSAAALGHCFKDVDYPSMKQRLLAEDLFDAANRFGIRLLQTLNVTGNVFLSPFGIWTSMVLVYLGSKGTTEKQLEGLLSLQGADKDSVARGYRAFKQRFPSSKYHSTTFSMLNNLFLQKDIEVRGCLLQFVDQNLAYVDFERSPELTRIAINLVVRRHTGGKIRDILPPHSVHSFTELLVTSAMHFEGAWLQPFPQHATKKRPFFTSELEEVLVDSMATRDTFLHATSDELQCTALELPYVGRSLSMIILLPRNKAHGVQILVSSLTPARLEMLMEDMFPREVVLVLPKFQVESSFQMSTTLARMGLRDLAMGTMDLGGFTKGRKLRMNAVYHKAHVTVDEQGTEAAAGTASALSRSSRPTRILDFIVDRPFVFLIRDNRSGNVVFTGIIRNPRYLT